MCSCPSPANRWTGRRRLWTALSVGLALAALPVQPFRQATLLQRLRLSGRQVPVTREAAPAAGDYPVHGARDADSDRLACLAAETHPRRHFQPPAAIPAFPTRPAELQIQVGGFPSLRRHLGREILAAKARERLPPACPPAFRLVCAACCGRVSIFACCSCNTPS
jgi:hypothetical protein